MNRRLKTKNMEGNKYHAGKAWMALATGVAAYDLLCNQGDTLSEGIDRALERHPVLTIAAIGTTALHLLNVFPQQYDPFNVALRAVKGD